MEEKAGKNQEEKEADFCARVIRSFSSILFFSLQPAIN